VREMADAMSTIKIRPNGPYHVIGPLTLIDPTGAEITVRTGEQVFLCRCGASNDKPYCDGSHKKNDFQAHDPARQRIDSA